MFNGLRVKRSGYYGPGMTALLARNKGSHEPQEVLFAKILEMIPAGSCMLECGAYWGFYSMWFAREVSDAKVWLIEPEQTHLEVGQANFVANQLVGTFINSFVGSSNHLVRPIKSPSIHSFVFTTLLG